MHAIDKLRDGSINGAARFLGVGVPELVQEAEIDIIDYHENPTQFKEEMLHLAKMLEEVGL